MSDEQTSALRAMAHPVRLRMMSLLTGTAMSAAEVARELDLTHANASYHLRQLLDAGQLVDAGEETIRGGKAKRYRYRYPHERQGAHAPAPAQPSTDDQLFFARAVSLEVERRLAEREPGPHYDFDLEGWVSPDVWEQACTLLREASHLLHEHNRAPRTPDTVHVSATGWAFQMGNA